MLDEHCLACLTSLPAKDIICLDKRGHLRFNLVGFSIMGQPCCSRWILGMTQRTRIIFHFPHYSLLKPFSYFWCSFKTQIKLNYFKENLLKLINDLLVVMHNFILSSKYSNFITYIIFNWKTDNKTKIEIKNITVYKCLNFYI